MEKPPQQSEPPTRKLDPVELRIANLHRELEAEPTLAAKAAILYQIGSLYERELAQTAQAEQSYERAAQACPSFEPALLAQIRLAERDLKPRSTEELCASLAAHAPSAALSASALVDRALHSEDWSSLLAQAIERSPTPAVPALLLEWLSEAAGDRDSLELALRVQAEHATDSGLRGALWIDLAIHEIERGEVDAALSALEQASQSEDTVWSARGLQRRLAKEHERWESLVRAAASMASLLEDALDADPASDPLRLPVPSEERIGWAVTLWQEAASYCADELGDTARAAGYLESALRLLPDDRQTRLRLLWLAERRDDPHGIEETSGWFQESAPDDAAFLALQIRRASGSEQAREGIERLRSAAERHPDSDYVRAALEVALMRHGALEDFGRQLREQARTSQGERQQLLLWRAAQTRAATGDPAELADLSDAAQAAETWKAQIVRDGLNLALHEKRADAVVAYCEALSHGSVAPEERASIAFCRYDATANLLHETASADRLLEDALEHREHQSWAPHLARVRGALGGNPALLARAHRALAERCAPERRAGHLCAAAEAHARTGDWQAAQSAIGQALEVAPDDRYALSLLDGVLRESGRVDRVLALAAEHRGGDASDSGAELSLLLAGATAEQDAELDLAVDAYEQAASAAPRSVSAALALGDVARRQSDADQRSCAYAALMDSDLGAGVPELFALLRGDALGLDEPSAPWAADAYERALSHPATASSAAVALLSMPLGATRAEARAAAEEIVNDAHGGGRPMDAGFEAAYGGLRASFSQEGTSAGEAWLQLVDLAPTRALRAQTLLQGIRTSRIARGEQALDDLLLCAQEAVDQAEPDSESATLMEEVLAPGDDPDLRVTALRKRLAHTSAVGRGALAAAHARALVDAGRGTEAVALLSRAVEERPDDLAVWEILRGAARQAEQWPLAAQACERLAQFVEGSLRADLLEEAGSIRLDCMAQDQLAEDLFRSALHADPTRDVAFRRLHDLLAEKEDAEGLEALVSDRLARGGPKDRPALLYERARLLRGFSDRPGALEVLDELFTTEPDHAGALALAVEVHVSLEQWEEAVDCLRRLASADIPEEQRRLAHLGAADFLQDRLGRADQALEELRAVEALGLADADVWARIGALEEGANRPEAAAEAYGRAHRADPGHSLAIAGLARLLEGADKDTALAAYETALWKRIESGEIDDSAFEELRLAALGREHEARAGAIASVARALGIRTAHDTPWSDALERLSSSVLRDPEASPLLEEALRRAGPSLSKSPAWTKKAAGHDPVNEGQARLDGRARFVAGRLAWAVPRGVGWLVEDPAPRAAGKIAALLRAARCTVVAGQETFPAAEVKLRRAARRSIQEVVGDQAVPAEALLSFVRSVQRSADRAGLLACADIEVALQVVLGAPPTLASLRSSARGFDLVRFCMHPESALWRSDARG